MQSAKPLRTVLLGAGSLGRAFLRRLRDDGGPIDLVAIVTGHHGQRIEPSGLDPTIALNMAEAGELGAEAAVDLAEVLSRTEADLLVECIPQNIRSGEPALGILRSALDSGINVITANKSPIALGYRDLRHRAAKGQASFRFGATVLDGLPIFTFVSALRGQKVVKVRGVLNATSSVVLETVGGGKSRSRGLARAQAQGIAEADPVLDLDGWDAAAKAALLANVWMDGTLRVVDVVRSGLETLKDAQIAKAAEESLHYRLVATIERDSGGVRASVAPTALEPEDSFWGLRGAQGGIEVETDRGHRFCFLQRSAGLSDAAGGLLSDCRAIHAGDVQL